MGPCRVRSLLKMVMYLLNKVSGRSYFTEDKIFPIFGFSAKPLFSLILPRVRWAEKGLFSGTIPKDRVNCSTRFTRVIKYSEVSIPTQNTFGSRIFGKTPNPVNFKATGSRSPKMFTSSTLRAAYIVLEIFPMNFKVMWIFPGCTHRMGNGRIFFNISIRWEKSFWIALGISRAINERNSSIEGGV